MPANALSHVVLSWPTPVGAIVAAGAQPMGGGQPQAPQSWIQIAKCGNFVSQRYGKFSITTNDLSQMLNNFKTITPKAPTKLPIDYDHLSMDPQRPGDGQAAGWISDLQLRDAGDTLWGLVEWTPDAAQAIKSRQYQFVSPSFVKDYVYKDGNVIGTTLLAAAITNHPFLEGMAALTLSGGLRELQKLIMAAEPMAAGGMAVEVGQKVSVKDDEVQKPEQMGIVFTIAQVIGEGENAFVSLQAPDGTIAEWFRANELQPAVASAMAPPPAPGALPEKQGATFAAPVMTPTATAPTPPTVPTLAATPENPESKKAPQLAAPLPGVTNAPLNSGFQKIASQGTQPGQPAKTPSVPMHPHPATAQVGMNARREKTMKTFELTDTNGQKVTVSEDALLAAVPPGDGAEVEELREQVITLSGQVEIMANAAASAEKRVRTSVLVKELDRLSQGGFITRPMRQWAEKTFGGDTLDLAAFKEWASLQTAAVVKLNVEHGSGGGGAAAESPEERLINLAHKLEKERRISYRDALILASKQDADSSERYRDQFGNTQ